MRVAVHFPDGSVAAYHLGRIEDGVHNKLWHTGATVPIDEFVQALAAQARAEYPDCNIVLEHLVVEGGEGRWEAEPGDGQPAGESHDHEVGVGQVADAQAGGN